MEFKGSTVRAASLDSKRINMHIEDLKAMADRVVDADGYIQLADLAVGQSCRVFSLDHDRNKAVLNCYERVR